VAGAAATIVVAIGVLMVACRENGANLGAVYPADGAVLPEPPGQVSLNFDATVRAEQIHIGLSDVRGELVRSGVPVVAGTTITEPVTIRADGDYALAYHVVLVDGRTFYGINRFRVSSSLAAPAPVPNNSAPPAAAGHDHFGDDPLSIELTVVAAVFVIALLVILIHRPRPRRQRRRRHITDALSGSYGLARRIEPSQCRLEAQELPTHERSSCASAQADDTPSIRYKVGRSRIPHQESRVPRAAGDRRRHLS
jgi:methionine-rich copper-binding protein CopC